MERTDRAHAWRSRNDWALDEKLDRMLGVGGPKQRSAVARLEVVHGIAGLECRDPTGVDQGLYFVAVQALVVSQGVTAAILWRAGVVYVELTIEAGAHVVLHD